jgi:hypothetical protein
MSETRDEKELLRKKIHDDVKAFLDAGGLIEEIPFGVSGGSDDFFRIIDRPIFGSQGDG